MRRGTVISKLAAMVGDIAFINLAFIITFYIRYLGHIPQKNFSVYLDLIPYISLFALVLLQLYNFYSNPLHQDIYDILYSFIPICVIIVVFTTVLSYFLYAFSFPRSVILLVLPIMLLLMMLWRYGFYLLIKRLSGSMKAVIIGGSGTIKLLNNIKASTNGSYQIEAVIMKGDGDSLKGARDMSGSPAPKTKSFKDIEELRQMLREIKPEIVFIANGLTEEEKKQLFYVSLEGDWQVSLVPDFYEIMLSGARIEHIGELPVFEMEPIQRNEEIIIKRAGDILLSALIMLITLPVMVLVALMIKIESPGPVFFKQERVSKDGRVFNVYKFRTMIENAEAGTGPVLAKKDDNRVTRVGRFLRKTRIDELPQLINVFKGEMSLIGPRPERPFFVEKFEGEYPEYKYRHQLKTGVTGLAQIYGYYNTDPSDKLRMDLLYAKRWSLLLDLKILLQTIKVMITKNRGS